MSELFTAWLSEILAGANCGDTYIYQCHNYGLGGIEIIGLAIIGYVNILSLSVCCCILSVLVIVIGFLFIVWWLIRRSKRKKEERSIEDWESDDEEEKVEEGEFSEDVDEDD